MKFYSRLNDGPLKKGQMFLDYAGWAGIVMEAERTKKFNDTNIINCTEIYGFAHDCGSKYAKEVAHLISEEEFEQAKERLGFKGESNYFKGKLIGV